MAVRYSAAPNNVGIVHSLLLSRGSFWVSGVQRDGAHGGVGGALRTATRQELQNHGNPHRPHPLRCSLERDGARGGVGRGAAHCRNTLDANTHKS